MLTETPSIPRAAAWWCFLGYSQSAHGRSWLTAPHLKPCGPSTSCGALAKTCTRRAGVGVGAGAGAEVRIRAGDVRAGDVRAGHVRAGVASGGTRRSSFAVHLESWMSDCARMTMFCR